MIIGRIKPSESDGFILGSDILRKQWITPGGTAAAVCLNMLKQPHLLIAGSTGNGKSVLINNLIYTALFKSPNQCKLRKTNKLFCIK